MLDAYAMIERYCNLLIERVYLIEQERECPEELKEAASSMLYAASRCGDFSELQEIRSMLSAHFGKEFAARSIELRNNCGSIMTQILATRMPSRESRMKVLREIAFENSIVLNLEETNFGSIKDKKVQPPPHPMACSSGAAGSAEVLHAFEEEKEKDDKYSKKKYKDVAHVAQVAFESAAYAASTVRAAVELLRSETHDSDDQTVLVLNEASYLADMYPKKLNSDHRMSTSLCRTRLKKLRGHHHQVQIQKVIHQR